MHKLDIGELTAAGHATLERARPTHDAALAKALEDATAIPELAPLVSALHTAAPHHASGGPVHHRGRHRSSGGIAGSPGRAAARAVLTWRRRNGR